MSIVWLLIMSEDVGWKFIFNKVSICKTFPLQLLQSVIPLLLQNWYSSTHHHFNLETCKNDYLVAMSYKRRSSARGLAGRLINFPLVIFISISKRVKLTIHNFICDTCSQMFDFKLRQIPTVFFLIFPDSQYSFKFIFYYFFSKDEVRIYILNLLISTDFIICYE